MVSFFQTNFLKKQDMGVILSKFWRFCLWLEGGEGVGLIAETRILEGTYSRTQQEGLLEILKQKLGGVADVKRLEKAVSADTILRVKHKEAEQGELFNSVWEFVVIRSKLEEWWVLTMPQDPNTLASGEHFMVPKFTETGPALLVARSDDFDKILIWEEGMPAGSLRREFIFEGDKVTLNTLVYGTKLESVEVFERQGSA